jgi:hypothetical protein
MAGKLTGYAPAITVGDPPEGLVAEGRAGGIGSDADNIGLP